jgi:hypothetical protein
LRFEIKGRRIFAAASFANAGRSFGKLKPATMLTILL